MNRQRMLAFHAFFCGLFSGLTLLCVVLGDGLDVAALTAGMAFLTGSGAVPYLKDAPNVAVIEGTDDEQ